MIGLFTTKFNTQLKAVCQRLTVLMFVAVLFAFPMQSRACMIGNDAPTGESSAMIQITGHSVQGNSLIITYEIKYPGMTKVKLFNGKNELLWRSQYVDDKEGQHRLVLKASLLNPGNYVFEFDYKNQKQNYSISM
jgi:hypothetical protein